MKLTLKTYYTSKNNYLTSSKIKDYLKDPYYFYQKHITHEIVETLDTPSVRIGSAVDCYLTRGASIFNKSYMRKVMKKENPDMYAWQSEQSTITLLTTDEWERALAIIDNVKRTTLYKDIKKNFKKQVILQHDMPLGPFTGIAGALDFYKIDGDKAIIIDLKTTSDASEGKFRWQATDLKYWLQQAVYQMLVHLNYPQVKECKSYILAVENNGPVYDMNIFELDQEIINLEKSFISTVIQKITLDKFKPKDLNWYNVLKI
jgi:hypothetical protein